MCVSTLVYSLVRGIAGAKGVMGAVRDAQSLPTEATVQYRALRL